MSKPHLFWSPRLQKWVLEVRVGKPGQKRWIYSVADSPSFACKMLAPGGSGTFPVFGVGHSRPYDRFSHASQSNSE